ncbi:hypothetical protein Gpo141_00006227 [Globisporangium polare]
MCKHIANVQFAFQAPCCRRWFDCSECHFELSDHRLAAAAELAMLCRTCETPFRKDLTALGSEDEACPHCAAVLNVPMVRPNLYDHPPSPGSSSTASLDVMASPSQSASASTDASSKSGGM